MGSRISRRRRMSSQEESDRDQANSNSRPSGTATGTGTNAEGSSSRPAAGSASGNTSSSSRRILQRSSDGGWVSVSLERTSDEEPELDLTTILRFLIQRSENESGQVRVVRSRELGLSGLFGDDSGDEDDDDDFVPAARDPQYIEPDTNGLDKHDLKGEILTASGRRPTAQRPQKNSSFIDMLNKREIGMLKHLHFTSGDRSEMSTGFIPNCMERVASYHHKAFCGQFSQSGDVFITACQDQNIRIYDTTGNRFRQLKGVAARDVGWSVVDTAFSPDGNFVIYSSWSEFVHMVNVYGAQETHVALDLCPMDRRFCVFSLKFSEDNKEILCGANDRCAYVYDRERGERTLRVEAHEDDVNCIAFADCSSYILYSGGDDGLVKVWDRRTLSESYPKPIGVLAGHSDGITHIDSKGDGRYLISNSKDQTIKLWDIRRFSSDDAQEQTRRAVANQSWDYRWQGVPRRSQRKQQLLGDSSLMTYRGHCVLHTLIRAYFSPLFTTGQRYIITGCATGSFIVYDILTGKKVAKHKQHKSCVRDVAWHPYDNVIMTSSWDGKVGRWYYKRSEPDLVETSVSGDEGNTDTTSNTETHPQRTSGLRDRLRSALGSRSSHE
ncbi:PREDICTED: DDB1- and CUL4-associated factor 11-like isoform X3 [Priapulus caudatus]|uniref:DDB1- and CUL4-associated factor 11-like isoform X3 n=1 Tax=Priapulus caudatus TaxID=37621 RepID=A0ABM1FAK3_PRICU|nr:PREDICTED: DDB1- and CUL4-associated factor 11-like isoform X3 [Priapulus caudatus]